MIPVYCVHYDKLTERRKYIESTQVKYCEFITKQYNIEHYVFYNPSPTLWSERCKKIYDNILKEQPSFRELKLGDLACLDKHLEALVKGQFLKTPFLVIEDDIIQNSDFFKASYELLSHYEHWDVAIIGGAFPHQIIKTIHEISPNIIKKDHPATNTVSAYMIKPMAATRLASAILKNKFVLPVDYEYNYWFKELNFDVVHYIPYVFQEGSSAGYYKGTQER